MHCRLSKLLLFQIFSIFLAEAVINLPQNSTIPAVIVFGDSVVDTGNNNYLETIVKVNYPPYGQDFVGGIPTGRFSDGKVPSDLMAEELGIKELLPAYFDQNLEPEDLLTGVNFASGGSGYDPLTSHVVFELSEPRVHPFHHISTILSALGLGQALTVLSLGTSFPKGLILMWKSVLSLSDQLEMFRDYIAKLEQIVGLERTSNLLSESLFALVTGSNDVTNTYFGTVSLRRSQYNVSAYTDLLVSYASTFVQDLYNLGARRIGVFGLPPLGCLPSQRSLKGGSERKCVDSYNEAAEMFNKKLSAQMSSINSQHSDARLIYIDIYHLPLDLIHQPQKYGFVVSNKGCCGTGTIEVAFLCKYTCWNVSEYVFWDSFHLTEKAYRILVHQILIKSINIFIS